MPIDSEIKFDQPSDSKQGRIIALDMGRRRVGVAVCDELRLQVRPLKVVVRTQWKELLKKVDQLIREYDAKVLVIGLPLKLDGQVGDAAQEMIKITRNFERSLSVPVVLQDERLTSYEAEEHLRAQGLKTRQIRQQIDSEAAVVILRDYLNRLDYEAANH
ncbi:MAG: Holliday junction resolvase RuvX [Pyrinomonadaceae bacterium]